MHQDPYLKKLAEEQKKILKQLLAGETDNPQSKPPIKYPEIDISGAGFKQSVSGIFVPEDTDETWSHIDVDALTKKPIPGWSMQSTASSNIMDSMKSVLNKVYGHAVQQIHDFFGPPSQEEVDAWFGESAIQPGWSQQKILRAHHGRKYEYVWSETLKCQVRIGESLKIKRG